MKTRLWLVLIFAGWVATGCQSMHVQTQYDQQVAFAGFHTYCWVSAPSWLHDDPKLHMDLVEPVVQQVVEAQLQARGFRSVDCTEADFQVTFTGEIEESVTHSPGSQNGGVPVAQFSSWAGKEWFTDASGMTGTEHRVPSLVIQIQAPRTDRVLWQGTASADLPAPADDAERKQRMETAVRMILEKFPPLPSK